MHISLIGWAVLALIVIQFALVVSKALLSPTRHIPGPFLARFTRLWYFNVFSKGDFEQQIRKLHQRYAKKGDGYYAPVVRVGPNLYTLKAPDKQVYGITSKMPKSAWYDGWKHPSPDRWTLFPDRDMARHSDTRRKFQSIYSLSSLVSYEKYVDECLDIFQERLEQMAKGKFGDYVDMGHWLQCYAFDVIGAITYSRRFGFLDQGRDIDNVIQALDRSMFYSSAVGVYPWLHPWLYDIMQRLPNSGAGGRTYIMQFASRQKAAREDSRKSTNMDKPVKKEGMPEDFLDKLMDARDAGQRGVTDYHVYIMSLSNIIAGSDTTATSLSAIFYHLIRNRRCLSKLRKEIAQMTAEGKCEAERVSFTASQEMPYLQAVIKEALRLHAAVGLPLWRVVGKGGAHIGGEFLPEGSEVGVEIWLAHYDKDIWGDDADEFRPERWIEAEAEEGDRLKTMEQYYMPVSCNPCSI